MNLIGATRTKTGLRVKARVDSKTYQAGIKISDEEMDQLNLQAHEVHPIWNYTISPRRTSGPR